MVRMNYEGVLGNGTRYVAPSIPPAPPQLYEWLRQHRLFTNCFWEPRYPSVIDRGSPRLVDIVPPELVGKSSSPLPRRAPCPKFSVPCE